MSTAPRPLSARLIARRIAKARSPDKRLYVFRHKPECWLTPEKVYAAADEVLRLNEPPSCGNVSRVLGKSRTHNTVSKYMRNYWADVFRRLASAGLVYEHNP